MTRKIIFLIGERFSLTWKINSLNGETVGLTWEFNSQTRETGSLTGQMNFLTRADNLPMQETGFPARERIFLIWKMVSRTGN